MKGLLKALIYIGGVVASFFSIIVELIIMNAIMPGYRFGYLINLAIIWFFWFDLPKHLCAMLDVKAFEKEASEKGMTPGAYASTYFAPSLLDLLEDNMNDKRGFEEILKRSITGDAITKAEANVLRYMFRGRK